MSAKVIDQSTVGSEQDFQKASDLAKKLKVLGADIALKQEEYDNARKELVTISVEQFFTDLNKDVPELVTNHEYHTDDGIVNVNFRVVSKPMTEIGKRPVDEVLKEKSGDNYTKLFSEDVDKIPTVEYPDMLNQATKKPELFAVRLREVTPDQLRTLVCEHPELVEVTIRDVEEYGKHFPGNIKQNVSVKPVGNFIDACAALNKEAKVALKGFFKTFFKTALSPALSTGNSAKTSKKK